MTTLATTLATYADDLEATRQTDHRAEIHDAEIVQIVGRLRALVEEAC